MRYKDLNDLPDVLKHLLPNREAQAVYLKVYNETWDSFQDGLEQGSREIEAHRDGWAAVEREFVHDEEKGIWYRQGEKPEEQQTKHESFMDRIKHLVM